SSANVTSNSCAIHPARKPQPHSLQKVISIAGPAAIYLSAVHGLDIKSRQPGEYHVWWLTARPVARHLVSLHRDALSRCVQRCLSTVSRTSAAVMVSSIRSGLRWNMLDGMTAVVVPSTRKLPISARRAG